MARRHPPIDPTGYYHVSSRGSYGRIMFQDPSRYELFLTLYGRRARAYGWNTLAWAQIKNHDHFLIELTNGGLSNGMRVLNSGFARRVNAMDDLTNQGHYVRHGFYAGQLTTEGSVLAVARYIDLNATRAGLGDELGDWKWSSYRANVGLSRPRPFHDPGRLLRLIGGSPRAAREDYARYVQSSLVEEVHDPWSEQG